MTEVVLRVEGVGKSFGGLKVLERVDLTIEKGARRGIIGPNGAGKTTLFNIISGYLPPTAGTINLMGNDVTRMGVDARARRGMGRTFQVVALFDELTVNENILLGLASRNRWHWRMFRPLSQTSELVDEAELLLKKTGLWELRDQRVATIAYGFRRVLEIAMALTNDTSVLLLDEPAAGLSKEETLRLMSVLQEFDEHLTFLLIEHDMEVMFQLVDTITVLDRGRVLMEGTPEEVSASDEVRDRYLGTVREADSE
jgi:branched-chain amino acid transport system ATP-binding protein